MNYVNNDRATTANGYVPLFNTCEINSVRERACQNIAVSPRALVTLLISRVHHNTSVFQSMTAGPRPVRILSVSIYRWKTRNDAGIVTGEKSERYHNRMEINLRRAGRDNSGRGYTSEQFDDQHRSDR